MIGADPSKRKRKSVTSDALAFLLRMNDFLRPYKDSVSLVWAVGGSKTDPTGRLAGPLT